MRVLPASLALTSGAGTQHRGEYCNPVRVVPLDVADPALHEKLCCESGLLCDTREHGHYKCVKRISKGCHEDQYASSRFACLISAATAVTSRCASGRTVPATAASTGALALSCRR